MFSCPRPLRCCSCCPRQAPRFLHRGGVRLHPRAAELKALYERDPQAFFREVYGGADVPKQNAQETARSRATGLTYALPAAPLDDAFWQRLSRILSGAPVVRTGAQASSSGGGGSAPLSVVNAGDIRGANFMPPYAVEFLNVFAPPDRTQALRDIDLHCAQLVQAGVNVVQVWYGYQSYKHNCATNGTITLHEVLTKLERHGLQAIVVLGNSYGSGSLDATQQTHRCYFTGSPPLPFTADKLITADNHPWSIPSVYFQTPGNGMLEDFDKPNAQTFVSFRDGDWAAYVSAVASQATAHPASFLACEVWNEPEGGSGGSVFQRIGDLIHQAVGILELQAPQLRLALGASSGIALEAWATSWLNPHSPIINACPGQPNPCWVYDDYLKLHIDWYVFHPTVVMNYHSVGVVAPVPSPHPYVTPGYPPFTIYDTPALRAWQGGGGGAYSVVELTLAFLNAHSGTGALLGELCIRGIVPQALNDVDLAVRDRTASGWPPTIGTMAWQTTAGPLGPWAVLLPDGTPVQARELGAMKDRNHPQKAGHGDTEIKAALQGVMTGAPRIHAPPSANPAIQFSNNLRPLILEGGSTVVLLFVDAFDDVPTHSTFYFYPATTRDNARNKIWVRVYRTQGTTVHDSGVINLKDVAGVGTLAAFSSDLAFRDIDDNRSSPTACLPLPLRQNLYLAYLTLGSWIASLPEANGSLVPLDATWGGIGGCTSPPTLIATLFNPCGFVEYGATASPGLPMLPLVERQFMVAEQMQERVRQQYVGLSGMPSGAYRTTTADGKDHFVIAFGRALGPNLNPSEPHYGPGADARVHSDPQLAWSANYGDFFRNDPLTPGQPLKREVVVVDLATQVTGALQVTGQAQVLPSVGQDPIPSSGRGAEAVDPVVACNGDGDTAIAARVAQDPYFYFVQPPQDDTVPWNGAQVQGGPIPSGCGLDFLPIPYTRWAPSTRFKDRFDVFHRDSQWRVYPWETCAWVRKSGDTATWLVNQLRTAEPMFPVTASPRDEDWSKLQNDLHDIQRRDPLLRAGFGLPDILPFNRLWHNDSTWTAPTISVLEATSWQVCTRPQVAIGSRTSGGTAIPVLVAWNQFPAALRANFVTSYLSLPQPAYEVRGLRFTVDVNTGALTAPNSYADFGSTTVRLASGPRVAGSVQGACAPVFLPVSLGGGSWDDTGTARAFYQMEETVFRDDHGLAATRRDPPTGGPTPEVVRVRPPKAATHGRVTLPSPHPQATLEFAAWIKPQPSPSTEMSVAFEFSLHQAGLSSSVLEVKDAGSQPPGAVWKTTDPQARVVAVVPFVGTAGSGWPTARIVWQANKDVWWTEVEYFNPSQTQPSSTISRVSNVTSGDGFFPVHDTEVSVSAQRILWVHDGTVMAIKP